MYFMVANEPRRQQPMKRRERERERESERERERGRTSLLRLFFFIEVILIKLYLKKNVLTVDFKVRLCRGNRLMTLVNKKKR